MKNKLVPLLILAGAGVAGYFVWKRNQTPVTAGSAAVDTGVMSGGFMEDFFSKFGLVAPSAPAPSPAASPAPAVAVDNGTSSAAASWLAAPSSYAAAPAVRPYDPATDYPLPSNSD